MNLEELMSDAQAAPRPEQGTGAGAAPDAAAFFRQLGEQTSKVLMAAEEAARDIKEQARRDAAGILAEARIQANELALAAAAERRGAEDELRRFREARTILANQIEDVHRRLEEIILRLRTPVEAPDTAPPPVPPAAAETGGRPRTNGRVAREPSPRRGESGAGGGADQGGEPSPRRSESGAGGGADQKARPPQVAPAPSLHAPAVETEPAVAELPHPDPKPAPAPAEPALPEPEPAPGPAEPPLPEPTLRDGALAVRAEALGEAPLQAGRALKRLLQEDQNDLLDRIRRHRGKGTFAEDLFPTEVEGERFVAGLRPVLQPAFLAGRRVGGAPVIGEPPDVVAALVAKQVVGPLRRDLGRMIEPRLLAGDTATTVSERAGDVYRVWKGVRTELLGEGLVFAAFHHGLLDAWREANRPGKCWSLSPDEADCPKDACRANATAGVVGLDAPFPSGHLAPPAHGGCTCTVEAAER